MSATRPLQLNYLRAGESAKPGSTALVPLVESAQWVPPAPRGPTPDPIFVTQLIANAERLADRRRWPRDRAADAFSAYARQPRHYGRGAHDKADALKRDEIRLNRHRALAL